ncbi:universal stress protein [Bradyrhizobium sp. CCBAU 051011]|uniref:universal stress protein n=1 Tax=Bradyrhizobium sp. CCBAU 051011 TaxID=858422 RepID=UPI001373BEF0|nr:universal stress protein [Bradyrhizobium sp. CCBAU 051011]QHO75684.1 universal stress protein [Bradyrhizobium sp. CCBAU 051011]
MHILAATNFSTRSQRALRRAGQLAQVEGAELAIVNVVDYNQPQHRVEMDMREAERILAELTSSMPELREVQCCPLVVSGDPFDAILRTAAAQRADLIAMGAHRRQPLRDIFVGTTIERLIRTGPYPVLIVNNDVKAPYGTVLAPIDMSEPSANAIRVARATGLMDEAHFTILHAFLPLANGMMFLAGLDRARIDKYVSGERQKVTEELAAFLVENDLGVPGSSLRVEEGGAFEVISGAVDKMRPDLLVIGTNGRSGMLNALLGSVADEALRSLNVDILAVPPVKQQHSVQSLRG